MNEQDAKQMLSELETEVSKMDLQTAYTEMRRAQFELARYKQGTRAATEALEVSHPPTHPPILPPT